MAFNPFIGWTQAQLEAALREAQSALAYNQDILSTGAGDTSASFRNIISTERSIERLYKALNALDSTTYPLTSITRVDRTRVRFVGSSSSSSS